MIGHRLVSLVDHLPIDHLLMRTTAIRKVLAIESATVYRKESGTSALLGPGEIASAPSFAQHGAQRVQVDFIIDAVTFLVEIHERIETERSSAAPLRLLGQTVVARRRRRLSC
jgi:hypothetical protein